MYRLQPLASSAKRRCSTTKNSGASRTDPSIQWASLARDSILFSLAPVCPCLFPVPRYTHTHTRTQTTTSSSGRPLLLSLSSSLINFAKKVERRCDCGGRTKVRERSLHCIYGRSDVWIGWCLLGGVGVPAATLESVHGPVCFH